MDAKILAASFMKVMEPILGRMTGINPSEPPQTKEIDIIEYDGRMRVGGLDKFNAPAYLSVINFYLNAADKERGKAKGALILYLELENASKFFKALDFSFPDDEDDVSMMAACGEFCKLLSEDFQKELVSSGYADLVMSSPSNYKNSVIEGVEYSPGQKTKQEFSFFYFRRKVIVVELTLAPVPQKN